MGFLCQCIQVISKHKDNLNMIWKCAHCDNEFVPSTDEILDDHGIQKACCFYCGEFTQNKNVPEPEPVQEPTLEDLEQKMERMKKAYIQSVKDYYEKLYGQKMIVTDKLQNVVLKPDGTKAKEHEFVIEPFIEREEGPILC